MRQILTQGDLDGACFLYCLANTAQALTCKPVDAADWIRGILALPFDMRDFMAGRGTEKLDKDPDSLVALARGFLRELGVNSVIVWQDPIRSLQQLRSLATAHQVVIMAVHNDAHWVTVVDVSEEEVFVACSVQALDGAQSSLEQVSPNFGRYYNQRVSFAKLKAKPGHGLSVSLA